MESDPSADIIFDSAKQAARNSPILMYRIQHPVNNKGFVSLISHSGVQGAHLVISYGQEKWRWRSQGVYLTV